MSAVGHEDFGSGRYSWPMAKTIQLIETVQKWELGNSVSGIGKAGSRQMPVPTEKSKWRWVASQLFNPSNEAEHSSYAGRCSAKFLRLKGEFEKFHMKEILDRSGSEQRPERLRGELWSKLEAYFGPAYAALTPAPRIDAMQECIPRVLTRKSSSKSSSNSKSGSQSSTSGSDSLTSSTGSSESGSFNLCHDSSPVESSDDQIDVGIQEVNEADVDPQNNPADPDDHLTNRKELQKLISTVEPQRSRSSRFFRSTRSLNRNEKLSVDCNCELVLVSGEPPQRQGKGIEEISQFKHDTLSKSAESVPRMDKATALSNHKVDDATSISYRNLQSPDDASFDNPPKSLPTATSTRADEDGDKKSSHRFLIHQDFEGEKPLGDSPDEAHTPTLSLSSEGDKLDGDDNMNVTVYIKLHNLRIREEK